MMENMIYWEKLRDNKMYKKKHKGGKAQCKCCLICLSFVVDIEQACPICTFAIPQRFSLPLLYKSCALDNFNKFPKRLVRFLRPLPSPSFSEKSLQPDLILAIFVQSLN
jgi:hypothetical protein